MNELSNAERTKWLMPRFSAQEAALFCHAKGSKSKIIS
ncbi:hypothetical protein SAMN04487886_112710, partial [Clostridium sp. DSM 8431]